MFASEFITKLDNGSAQFSKEQLAIIMRTLEIFITDYDINRKETQLSTQVDGLPQCYKEYIVCKKLSGLSEETIYMYRFHLEKFISSLCKPIEEATTNDVRTYLYKVKTEDPSRSDRYIDNIRLIINGFYQWLTDEGKIERNVCKTITPIRYEAKEREPLTDDELVMVREACTSARDRAVIEFLYSTGARVSELCGIKISDVNFATREVKLFGKGRKTRTSYLSSSALFYIKEYLDERAKRSYEKDPEYLFVSERKPHHCLQKSFIRKLVAGIGRDAGLDANLFPHRIRHTTATHAISRGMDVTEVQKLLGHAKPETTLIYAKIAQDSVRNAHRKYII